MIFVETKHSFHSAVRVAVGGSAKTTGCQNSMTAEGYPERHYRQDLIELDSSPIDRSNAVITEDFRPCDLQKRIEDVLYEPSYEAAEENWTGLNVILFGVFKAVEQSRSLAERHKKTLGHYLNMTLEGKWIEHWVHAFVAEMS